ncbi:MAG: SanA protein [Ruminococcaceae bacterium]|nr:SanA protein [Oscillospiraceae bacterium]
MRGLPWAKKMLSRLAYGVRALWTALKKLLQISALALKKAFRWLIQPRPRLNRWLRITVCLALSLSFLLFGMALCISGAVKHKTRDRIRSADALVSVEPFDCVLVLGCSVYPNGEPSPMLADRMITAVSLMERGVSNRMVVSGDHRRDTYNEVGAMKRFAVERGVASEIIFQDHDGYSTYDSLARIRSVFGAKRIVIVTQGYHLHRALYLAEKLGIEAYGVSADLQAYRKQPIYNLREVLARCKDVYYGLVQPLPEVVSPPVSLSGNGDCTAEDRP